MAFKRVNRFLGWMAHNPRIVKRVFLGLMMALLFLCLCTEVTRVFANEQEASEVTFQGTNKCQGCGKPGEAAPGAKCSVFGHSCALLIETAVDKDGKEIEELKGKELNYRLNQQSIPLIKSEEYQGARLEIKGKWLKEKSEIEVTSFKRIEG
jgi:hypothetical protein